MRGPAIEQHCETPSFENDEEFPGPNSRSRTQAQALLRAGPLCECVKLPALPPCPLSLPCFSVPGSLARCLRAFALVIPASLSKLPASIPAGSPSHLQVLSVVKEASRTFPCLKIAPSRPSPLLLHLLHSPYHPPTCQGFWLARSSVSCHRHQGRDFVPRHPHPRVSEQGLAHSRRSINVRRRNGSHEVGGITAAFLQKRKPRLGEKTVCEPRLQSTSLARVQVAP